MASFYILTPPGSADPEKDTVFVRDGFSWLGFVFPLPWLLVRKLWLISALVVAYYVLTGFVTEISEIEALPIAFSLVLSLWVGLEGGHVRAGWLQKRGWDLKATISAYDRDEAEAIYFADEVSPPTAKIMATAPAGWTTRPSNPVALGLIGPYGSR